LNMLTSPLDVFSGRAKNPGGWSLRQFFLSSASLDCARDAMTGARDGD